MPTQKLDHSIIEAAVLGFEAQKQKIDAQIAELRALMSGGNAASAGMPKETAPKRKKFSAAARRHMKEAQQRRWAAIRGETSGPQPAAAPETPKRRRISEAGMKRIIAATKRRWAKVRAEKAAATKKVAPKKAAAKKVPAKKAAAKKAAKVVSATPAPGATS